MRAFISITCAAVLVGFSSIAAAQGKGAPKVKTTATAPKVKTTAPAPKATGSAKTGTMAHGGGHAKPSEPRTTHAGTATRAKTRPESPARATTTSSTSTTTTTAAGTIQLTPVQQKLQRNTNLASKLQSRLPAGTDLNTAAAGFKNLGQFVAAVNVSKNLGLDFPTLKTAMVTDGKSLGQAIQIQKGTTVDATHEAHQAESDANAMIRSTEKTGKPARTRSTGGRP
jgi:hypothetical protein